MVPVRFDPAFENGKYISEQLNANVLDFFECELRLGKQNIYKPFPSNITPPQFMPIFESTESDKLLAYCWFVKNEENRQFKDDHVAGLIYRIKNFAVGDNWYLRNQIWNTGAQLAFWYFGEIHVCDEGVIPSADRTSFEDNTNRQKLQRALAVLPQRLNKEARSASAVHRLHQKVREAQDVIDRRNADAQSGRLDAHVKPDIRFEIMEVIRDVEKRLKRAGNGASIDETRKKGKGVLKSAKKLLSTIDAGDKLYDVTKTVQMGEDAKIVFNIVIQAIREELAGNTAIIERIVNKISKRIEERFRKK